MTAKEGYVVSCNEDETEWFIVQYVWKDEGLRRVKLPERYSHESDASEARAHLIEAER